jgi:hypothetical protein
MTTATHEKHGKELIDIWNATIGFALINLLNIAHLLKYFMQINSIPKALTY